MRVIVPYTPVDPKTRLGPMLNDAERGGFARAMLQDVLDAIEAAGFAPTVLSPIDVDLGPVAVEVDERSLSSAVEAAIVPPMGVIMGDLPLLTSEIVREALSYEEDVVVGPGRGGGTNLLVVRDASFSVDYHGASFLDHREIARRAGLTWRELDSFRVARDVDEPDDLAEVLIHSTGAGARWLHDHGFELETTSGRVTIVRTE